MELVLRIWFIVSWIALSLVAGWLCGRWSPLASLAACIVLYCILLFRAYRTHKTKRKKQTKAQTLHVVSCGTFGLGIIIAIVNPFGLNKWVSGSVAHVVSIVHPLQYLPSNADTFLDDSHRDRLAECLPVEFVPRSLEQPLLVSFNTGLALLQEQDLHYIYGKGVYMIATQGDSSIFFIDNRFIGPQTLTKAQVTGGGIHLLWQRKIPGMYLHHWGDTFEGRLYSPGRIFRSVPNIHSQAIGFEYGACMKRNPPNDVIRILDAETGESLEAIDLTKSIAEMGEEGETLKRQIRNCGDPFHLNAVNIVKTERHAAYFPNGKIGDLLISLRHVNTVLLLDRDTHAVKWFVMDAFDMQHSPTITDHGTVLIFDNRGSAPANGTSRIVEIDIATRATVGVWEASGTDYFESRIRGKVYPLDDRRILVQEESPTYPAKHDASIFLLECPGPRISMECKKTTVLSGSPRCYSIFNAALLPGQ